MRTVVADVNRDTVTAAVLISPRPDLAVAFVGDLASRDALRALLAHAQSAVGRVTRFSFTARHRHNARPITLWPSARRNLGADQRGQCRRAGTAPRPRTSARKLIAARGPGSFPVPDLAFHAGTPRNLPPYSTAKAALAPCWSRSLQKPSAAMASASTRWCPAPSRPAVLSPIRRWQSTSRSAASARSDDLAPMALAVLSNRVSAYVTGSASVVDGNLSLTNWLQPPELDDT